MRPGRFEFPLETKPIDHMKLNQVELFAAMGMLAMLIENCGASEALTKAVSYASDIRRAIGDPYNEPDDFAAGRVQELLGGPIEMPVPAELKEFTPAQRAIIIEHREMAAKVEKLQNLLGSDAAMNFSFEELDDMRLQLIPMMAYAMCLNGQITKFAPDGVKPDEKVELDSPGPEVPLEVPATPSPRDALVAESKTFRASLDGVLQNMKALRDELTTPGVSLEGVAEDPREVVPNLVLSIRHVEDAIMRQGMLLKAVGSPNPYPHSYDPKSNVVDKTADGLKL